MGNFEYKVVPAPQRGLKARGIKGTPARFANALETVMNDLATEGWEYLRTDTLPVEERQGLTGKTTTFQNMLVFRREAQNGKTDEDIIAGLIEDQSPAMPEPKAEAPTPPVVKPTPEQPSAAPAKQPIDQEAPKAADDAADAKVLGDEGEKTRTDRVAETLGEAFVFPWKKRMSSGTRTDPKIVFLHPE